MSDLEGLKIGLNEGEKTLTLQEYCMSKFFENGGDLFTKEELLNASRGVFDGFESSRIEELDEIFSNYRLFCVGLLRPVKDDIEDSIFEKIGPTYRPGFGMEKPEAMELEEAKQFVLDLIDGGDYPPFITQMLFGFELKLELEKVEFNEDDPGRYYLRLAAAYFGGAIVSTDWKTGKSNDLVFPLIEKAMRKICKFLKN